MMERIFFPWDTIDIDETTYKHVVSDVNNIWEGNIRDAVYDAIRGVVCNYKDRSNDEKRVAMLTLGRAMGRLEAIRELKFEPRGDGDK